MSARTHLFLSPHADDVPLSCGGFVNQLTKQGEHVHVLSLMVADPPTHLPESPYMEAIHARWEAGGNPYAIRRQEDTQAVTHLGATIHFGNWHDCIYRTDADGQALYQSDDELFGEIKHDDPLNSADLTIPEIGQIDCVYLPLGAGNHVDHQLVRNKAIAWAMPANNSLEVFGYEEYPYSSEAGEVLHSHGGENARLAGATATQTALQDISYHIELAVQVLSAEDVTRKTEALLFYQSQISTFWDSADIMRNRVWENVKLVGQAHGVEYAERLWRLT